MDSTVTSKENEQEFNEAEVARRSADALMRLLAIPPDHKTKAKPGASHSRRCAPSLRRSHRLGNCAGSMSGSIGQRRAAGRRAGVVALAGAAFIAAGSHAFAVIIPIQAILTGAGGAPPNDSPARGVMEGTFDTDANTLKWTVTYSGLATAPIGAAFHGPVPLGLPPEEIAPIQVATPGNLREPVPRRGQDRRCSGQGP